VAVHVVSFFSPTGIEKSSAYPFFICSSLAFILCGLLIGLSGRGWVLFFVRLASFFVCLRFWLKSVTKDFFLGKIAMVRKPVFRFGFGYFIVSEVVFFVSFF